MDISHRPMFLEEQAELSLNKSQHNNFQEIFSFWACLDFEFDFVSDVMCVYQSNEYHVFFMILRVGKVCSQ